MIVLKFGGTSIGSVGRIKGLIPLTCDGERKIVVLSALAGTTNNLVRVTDLLAEMSRAEAATILEEMRSEYHKLISSLFEERAK